MKLFTRQQLARLTESKEGHHISLYVPTEVKGEEKLGRIKLKNLLAEARDILKAKNLRGKTIDDLLSPAEKLLEDRMFWSYQSQGLAIFLREDFFQYYQVPIQLSQQVTVGNFFNVKPLFPLYNGDQKFYVLALSQNSIRLLQCTSQLYQELPLEDVPKSLEEAMRYDVYQKHIEMFGQGGEGVAYHGQGYGMENTKDQVLRFFYDIDSGVRKILQREEAPLILAGVEYLFPIYREANSYHNLMDEGIVGNPDEKTSKELHKRALTIIEPYYRSQRKEALEEFSNLLGTGKTSGSLEEVLNASLAKRIDKLFVAKDKILYGRLDGYGKVQLHEKIQTDSEDLLNIAALQTLANGGRVYALEEDRLPTEEPIAAIYRY
ncbi:baeRF7 domain-containing protein [Alkaliphilus serpentinus]|uniref:Uncharacterized protein n=1 Tax=Alkaliphilus serpentinus TaxID=1482731 RepID=A0A833M9R5_9FIRM|nr:hypothetical protein [Alkaliphilus serpentinus]KAB3530546.1 hypothetical protein F8153_06770 [Alkaliphilus serpentinus]